MFGKWGEMYGYSPKTKLIGDFWRQQCVNQADKFWDQFYKHNNTHFFKDRHWLLREFPELGNEGLHVFEVGCGVGNTIFPLLESNPKLFMFGADFSSTAIKLIQKHEQYCPKRCKVFVCDVTSGPISEIEPASLDFITLIFVLSAMDTDKMLQALRNLDPLLKPGGSFLFRDYSQGDKSQVAFESTDRFSKLDENLYIRGDFTQAFFFSESILKRLFVEDLRYEVVQLIQIEQTVENIKEEKEIRKKWWQAKFKKPFF